MTAKNFPDLLEAIKKAKAPAKFTTNFLEQLGFKSTNDRAAIGVLKALGLLSDSGEPTTRYFEFLDGTESRRVLADAIQEAYADLYAVNKEAHKLPQSDLQEKMKTISQGQFSEAVLAKMSTTFKTLSELADLDTPSKKPSKIEPEVKVDHVDPASVTPKALPAQSGSKSLVSGFHYNIQIILPESRDPAVYDALFRSLKEHLLV
jgi:hypothetical protein